MSDFTNKEVDSLLNGNIEGTKQYYIKQLQYDNKELSKELKCCLEIIKKNFRPINSVWTFEEVYAYTLKLANKY